jgi:hypothetical protein
MMVICVGEQTYRFVDMIPNSLSYLKLKILLWHVDPLLGNDLETGSHTIADAKLWLCKQRPMLGSGRNRHASKNI